MTTGPKSTNYETAGQDLKPGILISEPTFLVRAQELKWAILLNRVFMLLNESCEQGPHLHVSWALAKWYNWLLLDWPKNLLFLFHKIKDTFFIFTNNCIDLDILSMLSVSCYWLPSGQKPGVLLNIFQFIREPHSKYLARISIVPRNYANHSWHVRSVTAPPPYAAKIFFFFFWWGCVSIGFLPFLK